jgi:hypothetical protein
MALPRQWQLEPGGPIALSRQWQSEPGGPTALSQQWQAEPGDPMAPPWQWQAKAGRRHQGQQTPATGSWIHQWGRLWKQREKRP